MLDYELVLIDGQKGLKFIYEGYEVTIWRREYEDCFSNQRMDEVIKRLSDLPSDSLSPQEVELLILLKNKRKISRSAMPSI